MTRSTLLKLLLVFVVSTLVSFLLQRYFQITLEDIQRFVESSGFWAPIAYTWLLLLGLVVPFNPISDTITVSIAALVLPVVTAVVMTFVAHSLALTVNYWLAREYGLKILSRFLNREEISRIEGLKYKMHPGWVFGFRFLLPLNAVGFDFISYAAGISHMDFRKFYLVSIIPWTLLSLFFFSSASVLRSINPSLILVPILVVIAIPALVFALAKKPSIKERFLRFVKLKAS